MSDPQSAAQINSPQVGSVDVSELIKANGPDGWIDDLRKERDALQSELSLVRSQNVRLVMAVEKARDEVGHYLVVFGGFGGDWFDRGTRERMKLLLSNLTNLIPAKDGENHE